MWRMDTRFFESFPETYDDIIPAPPIEWPLTIDSADVEKYTTSSRTSRWPPLLPLPEDGDKRNLDSERASGLLSAAGINVWDTSPYLAVC